MTITQKRSRYSECKSDQSTKLGDIFLFISLAFPYFHPFFSLAVTRRSWSRLASVSTSSSLNVKLAVFPATVLREVTFYQAQLGCYVVCLRATALLVRLCELVPLFDCHLYSTSHQARFFHFHPFDSVTVCPVQPDCESLPNGRRVWSQMIRRWRRVHG